MAHLSFIVLTLIILNFIYLVDALFSGCYACKTYFINNKLYYVGYFDFFFIDLTEISLDDNNIIDSSKWINLPQTSDPNCTDSPFLGGEKNDKLFFTTTNSFYIKNYFTIKNSNIKNIFTKNLGDVNIDIFDTRLNKWETKINFTGKTSKYFHYFCFWISDEKTGKSYSFQDISKAIDIFDTINFRWSISTLIPSRYQYYVDTSLHGPPRVLLPSGKIVHIGGYSQYRFMNLMAKLLTYDTITDSWEMIVKIF